jgi:hypothetical protein
MPYSTLMFVNTYREALRDKAIEQHSKFIGLKVPAVYASPKIVSYLPDGFV